MSADQAPLVNKLVLLVLTLILACLVVLIAQQYSARNPPPPVSAQDTEANEASFAASPEPVQYAPLRPRSNPAPGPAPGPARAAFGPTLPPRINSAAAPAWPGFGEAPEDFARPQPPSAPPGEALAGVYVDASAGNGSSAAGRVTLLGPPPPEKSMQAADPVKMCGGGSTFTVTTRHFVVSEDGGLANVFVWIKSGLKKTGLLAATTPVLDQVGCQFEPYVLGLQAGQPLLIRNSDPGLHNVHAQPKPGSGNKEFNFGLPLRGQVASKTFPSPELFLRFKCDVHPWMFAYACVVDHPFFAVTDTNGLFRLPAGLPPGRYVLAASHQKAGETSQEITVGHGENWLVSFTLRAPPAN